MWKLLEDSRWESARKVISPDTKFALKGVARNEESQGNLVIYGGGHTVLGPNECPGKASDGRAG